MDDSCSIEPILETFGRHLELLERNTNLSGSSDALHLFSYVSQRYEVFLTRPHSMESLPSLFRYELPKVVCEFMLHFLQAHFKIPSTPPLSPKQSIDHSDLNDEPENEDEEMDHSKVTDPVYSYSAETVEKENEEETEDEEGKEGDNLLDKFLLPYSTGGGDAHQPNF